MFVQIGNVVPIGVCGTEAAGVGVNQRSDANTDTHIDAGADLTALIGVLTEMRW